MVRALPSTTLLPATACCCSSVRACVCEIVLMHPADVVVVLLVYADLSLDLPTDRRNRGRAEKVAKSKVA